MWKLGKRIFGDRGISFEIVSPEILSDYHEFSGDFIRKIHLSGAVYEELHTGNQYNFFLSIILGLHSLLRTYSTTVLIAYSAFRTSVLFLSTTHVNTRTCGNYLEVRIKS